MNSPWIGQKTSQLHYWRLKLENLDRFDKFILSRKLRLITLFFREIGSFKMILLKWAFYVQSIYKTFFQIKVTFTVFQYFERKLLKILYFYSKFCITASTWCILKHNLGLLLYSARIHFCNFYQKLKFLQFFPKIWFFELSVSFRIV